MLKIVRNFEACHDISVEFSFHLNENKRNFCKKFYKNFMKITKGFCTKKIWKIAKSYRDKCLRNIDVNAEGSFGKHFKTWKIMLKFWQDLNFFTKAMKRLVPKLLRLSGKFRWFWKDCQKILMEFVTNFDKNKINLHRNVYKILWKLPGDFVKRRCEEIVKSYRVNFKKNLCKLRE